MEQINIYPVRLRHSEDLQPETLARAIRTVANHHHNPDVRHIGNDDHRLLLLGANTIMELSGRLVEAEAVIDRMKLMAEIQATTR